LFHSPPADLPESDPWRRGRETEKLTGVLFAAIRKEGILDSHPHPRPLEKAGRRVSSEKEGGGAKPREKGDISR